MKHEFLHTTDDSEISSCLIPGLAHYNHSYDNKKRLASYWHQIDECLKLGGRSVLVVGKGSGLSSYLLQRQGFEVTTLDIQSELRPTIVGDVRQLPFLDEAFDIAVCCQVLEHLPFEVFVPALSELRRVIQRGLVLSLPDRGRRSTLLSYLLHRKEVVNLPHFRLKPWTFDGQHFWEVNTRGCRLRDVQHAINQAGLQTERTFRVWEHPHHRFWCLRSGKKPTT
jgi:2-polyprenyl-3-methyl-5-hydroxy-6-metoxy-1,4-benzoquinol methylase